MAGLYNDVLERYRQSIEQALPAFLPADSTASQKTVYEAMNYACTDGGKRLRPVLVMEFCRLCGGNPVAALPFACAVEMIHSYSLVHDDLPCMDNSPLRRGKPSVHAAYGEDMALLAGDGLLTRAFEVMLSPDSRGDMSPERALRAAFALADAAGAKGMVGGQVIDLQSEGKAISLAELETLQRGKTAALIAAACEMGCHIGGGTPQEIEAARRFGTELGLGFQIVDDILDVTSTPEALGKPVGGDEKNAKVTYVSLLGLKGAANLAAERTEKAVLALAPFGEEGAALCSLARALLERTA